MVDWDLIAKYLAGEATETERTSVENWLNESQENRVLLSRLKDTMRPDQKMPDFTEGREEDWNKIVAKHRTIKTSRAIKIHSFSSPLLLKIAASILLLLAFGLGLWKIGFSPEEFQRNYAAIDSVTNFALHDGSMIWLNKNASIELTSDFGTSDRMVTLKGEAYFEVAKDADKPFIIHSGDVDTKVLGTKFNINQDEDGTVIVTVAEGKVSVSETTNKSNVLLTIGESAKYNAAEKSLVKQSGPDLNFLTWKTGVLRFEASSLREVCAFLSDYYSVNITADTSVRDYKITTVFDNLTLDQVINIIMLTHDLKIKEEGTGRIFYK
jgi:transmembrane sensor